MGQIVPDAIERYLAGLNRAGNPILDDIARGNETRGLPLVDAEVGALLRVLATTVNAHAHPGNRHGDRLLGHLARGRAAAGRHAADDGDERGAGA